MRLDILLSNLDCIVLCPSVNEDIEVTGIEYDSRQVRPGNVFCAIKGEHFDGHDFVQQATDRGCCAVVSEQPLKASVPVIQVEDSRLAMAQLSKPFYGFPIESMQIIGVTASNGKTTTSFMIDNILSAHLDRTGLIGTVVVKDGPTVVDAGLTTPHSRDLFKILQQMAKNGCSHVTMEVSSAGLELHRVEGVDFNIGTFNNVSREHIDFHGTFENYWYQKSSFITKLSSQATAVLNADDELVASLQQQTAARTVTYSLKGKPASVTIRDLDLSTGRGRFVLDIRAPLPVQFIPLELKVLGLHNVYNATVAVIVALLCQVPAPVIQRALGRFGGVERRFELIYDGPYKVIDDHFANAGNIDITLETLKMMDYRQLVLLVAIRGNRGPTVNRENAETIVKWLDKLDLKELIVTESLGCVGENDTVSPEEKEAFLSLLDREGVKYKLVEPLEEAIGLSLENISPGDVMLLAGCQGMDCAAHIILPKIAANLPENSQKEVLELLKNRVAGSS